MKKITSVVICTFFFSIVLIFSQSKDKSTIIKIGDTKISKDEFIRIYNKNKNTAINEKKSKEEYLDLFINYKLKVVEAKTLGYDTVESFIEELSKYRDQLAKPYIEKNEIKEKLLREAYEHKKYILKPYSILARFQQYNSTDTAEAYNNILKVQQRLENGESFEDLVEEYSKDDKGMITASKFNWASAFDLKYNFEKIIFELPVDIVSKPIKTSFGYQIIKIMDKKPNPGTVKVAHIMTMIDKNASDSINETAKKRIYKYYDMLKQGADFAETARMYSDHKSSARAGGELRTLKPGKTPKVFENTAFSLKNEGDISEPIQTFFGWHIIKLLEKDTIGSYEKEKDQLYVELKKNIVTNKMLEEAIVYRLMDDYNFVDYITENDTIFNICKGNCQSLSNNYQNYSELNDILFKISDEEFTQFDFIKYLTNESAEKLKRLNKFIILSEYQNYIKKNLEKYEMAHLEETNSEFRNLMQEYREGILLFNLTSDSIWNKAVEDTAGLELFYENNKSDYMWEKRWDVSKYSVKDSSLLEKARELAVLRAGNKINSDTYMQELCGNDSIPCVSIKDIKTEKNSELIMNKAPYETGLTDVYAENNQYCFISVNKELEPSIKKLEEARGLIIADYQTYLEKQWIDRLRKKYPVEINYKLFKKIK